MRFYLKILTIYSMKNICIINIYYYAPITRVLDRLSCSPELYEPKNVNASNGTNLYSERINIDLKSGISPFSFITLVFVIYFAIVLPVVASNPQ